MEYLTWFLFGVVVGMLLTMLARLTGRKISKRQPPHQAFSCTPWDPLVGKVSNRTLAAVKRAYRSSGLKKPLDELTDEELYRCRLIGRKAIKEIRAVIRKPKK